MLRRESSSAGVDTRMRIGPRGEKKKHILLMFKKH
jgi:hypothetical protein